jgi:peroxiredoxin
MTSPFYLGLMTPSLAPGDPAFDFDLPRLDGSGRLRLSGFAGERPVCLIFGSYT